MTPRIIACDRQSNPVLQNYLEDSTALLVRSIQPLVNTIRNPASASDPTSESTISEYIRSISDTVQDIVGRTNDAVYELRRDIVGPCLQKHAPPVTAVLENCRSELTKPGLPKQAMPPIAFKIARATKVIDPK